MFRNFRSSLLASLIALVTALPGWSADKLFLTTVRHAKDLTTDTAPKLSPTMIAIKASGGQLKGADAKGSPIISVPESNIEAYKSCKEVVSSIDDVPTEMKPITKLKLSYTADNKPMPNDLDKMALTMLEDYQKGSYMIVEPKSKKIDSALAKLLEKQKTIR